jgi:hypothetical protein
MAIRGVSYHRKLGWYLVAEIVVIAAVVAIFRLIPSKSVAATVAGSLFVILGLTLFLGTLRTGKPLKQFLFWASGFFLFAVAIPMLFVRVWNWGVDFASLSVWGMSAPTFHQQSNTVYILMVIATVVDRFRLRRGV